MEKPVRSMANGHAINSSVESTEDAARKLLANQSPSDGPDQFDANGQATADEEREERGETDDKINWNCQEYKEPMEVFTDNDDGETSILKDSIWKLDRRESGNLFWRRDSSSLQDGVDPCSRVKFRFEVTVREYAEEQQEREKDNDSAGEQEVDDSGAFALRQRKGLAAARETENSLKSSTGMASSPIAIYTTILLAIIIIAGIHWYLWGRTAWSNLNGGRSESSL